MRRNGTRAGYSEFRYGSSTPVRLAEVSILSPKARPIFKGERRARMVDAIAAVLKGWRYSPFQNEGPSVAMIRAALCAEGIVFPAAEATAFDLVAAGLRQIGAIRPTWAEGQRGYTAPLDSCARCLKRLSAAQQLFGDRFCSALCAQGALQEADGAAWSLRKEHLVQSALRLVAVAARPRFACETCGKLAQKRENARAARLTPGRFCSARCAAKARRTMPEATCANPACGKRFRVKSADRIDSHKYCDATCYLAHRRAAPIMYDRVCALCRNPFQSAAHHARFCSKSCLAMEYQWRTGRVQPKRLTPKVFDYFTGRFAA